MRYRVLALILAAAVPAVAAPPPPPPEYVWKAGLILTDLDDQNQATVAALFADDVVASENGATVARSKGDWLRWRFRNAHPGAHIIAYSESWGHGPGSAGELLVIDTYDTVNRKSVPPNMLIDPRMAARSTLYRFGKDHLIHAVQVAQADSFWMTPHS